MRLTHDDWQRLISDQATNYVSTDYALSNIRSSGGPSGQDVLVIEAEHIESGVNVCFTFHLPPLISANMAHSFAKLALHNQITGHPSEQDPDDYEES